MSDRTQFPASHSRVRNRILLALQDDAYQRISLHLSYVELKQGQVLYNADNWIDVAYFINRGMASSLSVTAEGQTIEDGIVGFEGLMGGPAALGECRIFCSGIVQIPGSAMSITARALMYEFKYNTDFSRIMTDYLGDLRIQLDQSGQCHRVHSLEQRLCCLLLISQDCARSDIFPFTLKFLSHATGETHYAVSAAADILSEEGLISYRRYSIRIKKRKEMEKRACSCYQMSPHGYDQLALCGNSGTAQLHLVVPGDFRGKHNPQATELPE